MSARTALAKHAGMAVMEMVKRGIKARDIINKKSVSNALRCDMALGCSSNSVLHLLAIANEAGVELDLNIFNEYSDTTPNLCHLAPAGPTHMQDLYAAGGVQAVISELAKKDLIDLTAMTVTRRHRRRQHQGRQGQELRHHPSDRQALQRDGRPRDPLGQHRKERLRRQAQRGRSRNVETHPVPRASLTARTRRSPRSTAKRSTRATSSSSVTKVPRAVPA